LSILVFDHNVATTPEIISELQEVLLRPKFDRYGTVEERREYVAEYESRCRVLEIAAIITECRDPDDDKFLALALEAGADDLISGDIHLLEMNPWRGIPILRPHEYLALHAPTHLP
jgi:putative PIN family toxin of toxin-antitoxin system